MCVSALVHAVLLMFGLLEIPELKFEPEEEFQVSVREEPPREVQEPEPEVAKVVPEERVPTLEPLLPDPLEVAMIPEEEKIEEEKLEDPPKDPEPELGLKAVDQVTNEEVPDEAAFLSDQANKVEEETRAEDVTLDDVEPGKESPEVAEAPLANEPDELESNDFESEEHQEAESAQLAVEDVQPSKVDPRDLFGSNMAQMERIIGRDARAEREAQEHKGRPKLMADYEQSQETFKASLENFISEIRPGNHTGVNAHANPAASYLAKIHRRIHVRWADDYLMYLDTRVPMDSPLRNPSLHTQLEYVIDASSGKIDTVNIVKTSGNSAYDAAAISVSMAAGPHPSPPPEVISPNGKVYVHWQFWRDTRQCGTYGAQIYILNKEG